MTDTPTPTATPTDTPTPTSQGQAVFQDGFESGNLSAWNTSGGLTVQSGLVHAGSFAAQGNTTNGGTYAKKVLSTTYTDGYLRAYFNIASSASQVNLLRFRTATDGSLAYVGATSAGRLTLRNDVAGATINSATTVGAGWHALEFHATINGAASVIEVWLDGVQVGDLSLSTNLGTTPIGRLQIGEVNSGRTYNVVFDDVVFDTQAVGP